MSTVTLRKLGSTTKLLTKNLELKMKYNNAIIVKVDKGQSMVIMNKPEYKNKLDYYNFLMTPELMNMRPSTLINMLERFVPQSTISRTGYIFKSHPAQTIWLAQSPQ